MPVARNRILIVAECRDLQLILRTALEEAGYFVDTADDGVKGLQLASTETYSVIILDVVLPGMDGLSLLHALRNAGQNVHVMFLTARATTAERVLGLQAGADDYVQIPFALDEVIARVHAGARRDFRSPSRWIVVGNLELDLRAKRARCDGELMELSAREFRVLECLARQQGDVVSVADIEAEICDDKVEAESNVVASIVCILRKKMGQRLSSPIIETSGRTGYILGRIAVTEATGK